MAPFSKLQRRLLQRKRRKEYLHKILNLLQARRKLLLQLCFLNTLLFSSCFSITNDIHHICNAVFFPTRFPSNFPLLCPIANFRFSVAGFIFALVPSIFIAGLWNVFIKGFVFVPSGGNFVYIFVSSPSHHTSGVTSGNIQCAYSVKEDSPRGLLVTPRANEISPKYIHSSEKSLKPYVPPRTYYEGRL